MIIIPYPIWSYIIWYHLSLSINQLNNVTNQLIHII
jgi:hypothetical protein